MYSAHQMAAYLSRFMSPAQHQMNPGNANDELGAAQFLMQLRNQQSNPSQPQDLIESLQSIAQSFNSFGSMANLNLNVNASFTPGHNNHIDHQTSKKRKSKFETDKFNVFNGR
jgi:hypothetical protein